MVLPQRMLETNIGNDLKLLIALNDPPNEQQKNGLGKRFLQEQMMGEKLDNWKTQL